MPETRSGWDSLSASLGVRADAFIAGAFTHARDDMRMPSIDPATGTVIAQVAACGEVDVDRAVQAARAAFDSGVWSRADPATRRSVLLSLAQLIEDHADELAVLDSRDMGKPVTLARAVDVPGTVATFRYYAEAIDKRPGELAPTGPGAHAVVRRVPLGVVGAITAWNFPLETAAWKLAPALAAGNSVLLKPSERAPLSALRLAELAAAAGLPDGVLNVVPGAGTVAGRAIARHAGVDALAFTGSTAVGRTLLRLCGETTLKKVQLECGGKSPNIVFNDVADIDAAARAACQGAFANQGEVCSANSRLLVQREIAEEFVAAVARHAAKIQLGHPLDPGTDMGPLVDAAHVEHVMRFLTEAPAEAIITGGQRRKIEGSDCYVEPTIIHAQADSLRLEREEVFGPVLSVQPFDSEQDAVRIANDTEYGLAASVWTASLDRALRVSEQLVAGTVSVNTVDALSVVTPFGGLRQSGFGSDLSLHALDNYTSPKTTWISYSPAN